MTTNTGKQTRPGLRHGRTNEFTLFFTVKPGHGQQIREVFQQPGFEDRRKEMSARIGTLHDARWVLFDDDTRLMFATNFDGDWDAYIDDFAKYIPDVFDAILQHTEDYPGISDPHIKDAIVAHQATACSYFRTIPDATIKDLEKAVAVNEAFQKLLDAAG
ncbi:MULTISPECIES: hypothetical protein [unclassified Streptomyces]|uniref:hypothetical protein n=1 Tax=unclassified Streptomyces TaxID=2593676 RepID=UPI000C273541|nr:hypothetical protein [Streptomyces sp. CB02959]PJN38612.1 hypothetical protein CG747_21080 [Streptomyces sp. CB02959]